MSVFTRYLLASLNIQKQVRSIGKMASLGTGLINKIPILVLCGPSGCGKSTLTKILMKEFSEHFGFSISHTTRSPRPGETEGVDYHYVTREDMLKAIQNNEFIEHAEYSGNLYGTSTKSVTNVLQSKRICILDIDVQGVKQLKKIPDFQNKQRLVFIKPPSLDTLRRRLEGRGTETPESLAKRLAAAETEMEYGCTPGVFDIIIVNDDVDKAYSELREFILPDIKLINEIKTEQGSGDN